MNSRQLTSKGTQAELHTGQTAGQYLISKRQSKHHQPEISAISAHPRASGQNTRRAPPHGSHDHPRVKDRRPTPCALLGVHSPASSPPVHHTYIHSPRLNGTRGFAIIAEVDTQLASIRKSTRRVPPAPSLLQKDHILLTPSIFRTMDLLRHSPRSIKTNLFVLTLVDFLVALSGVSGRSPSSFSSYLMVHGLSSLYSVRRP